jgi:hypothetical protein
MSLFNRKPRPLLRDAASLRDDRLFIVACDDQYAPAQYFDCFRLTRVKIKVVPTEDGTSVAEYVLDRLLEFEHEPDDERWMLLDTDHCTEGTHLKGFKTAMQSAKRHGVKVALSRPCFELWLLLHCVDEGEVSALPSATKVEQALRSALGQYDKTRLRAEHYPFRSVAEACKRARRLDATVPGGEIPSGNTTRVYQLWKSIAEKALPSQLPDELRELAL